MGNICSGGQEKSKASAFAPVRGGTEDRSESYHDLDDNNGNKQAFNSNDSNQSIFDNNGHPLKNQQQLLLSDASPTDPTAATPNNSNNNNNNDNVQQLLLQQKQQRDEQNRLDAIVQMAGRGMVSVRSTRGSTGYYDQGFAAALGQHLERTTTFVDQLPIRLPPPPPAPAPKKSSQSQQQQSVVAVTNSSSTNSNSVNNNNDTAKQNGKTTATTMNVIQRLSQPPWENIALGTKGSGGGGGGFGGENPHAYMDLIAANLLDAVVPKKERIFHNNNDNNDGNGGGGGGRVGPMVENLL